MITPFGFRAPTEAVFGCGTRSRVPKMVHGGSCGVLSSPSVLGKKDVVEILDACRRSGIRTPILGHVSPNPRLSEVERAFSQARSSGVECVLAIGGGSVLDAAKLVRVALSYDRDPQVVLTDTATVLQGQRSKAVGLVAVPTTAGTGAEVSRGAIITDDVSDPGKATKKAARGQELVPDAAIVDPELSLSLPPRRTAETGFDVICHAIETLMSRAGNPLTETLARGALGVVPSALRAVYVDGSDLEAREIMAMHSWLMGYNLAHASTCLPHRMQYPVGSLTDTSHQLGLAAIYPAWVARLDRAAPELTRSAFAYLAREGSDTTDPEGTIRAFLGDIGLAVSLRDLGVEQDQLPGLAESVTGRVELDPIDPTYEDILRIFTEAYG